jgi:hypothetical protein
MSQSDRKSWGIIALKWLEKLGCHNYAKCLQKSVTQLHRWQEKWWRNWYTHDWKSYDVTTTQKADDTTVQSEATNIQFKQRNATTNTKSRFLDKKASLWS